MSDLFSPFISTQNEKAIGVLNKDRRGSPFQPEPGSGSGKSAGTGILPGPGVGTGIATGTGTEKFLNFLNFSQNFLKFSDLLNS